MTALAVAVAEDTPARLRNAVATFPLSFRTGSATPDVQVVGGDAGWTTRVRSLIDAGCRAVLVGDPVAEEVHELLAAARETEASVLLASVGADDPVLALMRERLAASDGSLLECRMIASRSLSRSATVMAMLTIVEKADSPVRQHGAKWGDVYGLHAAGRLESGRDVVLTIDVSEAVRPVARLRVVSSAGVIEADIPLSERTRPGSLRDSSADGEWHADGAYLSSSRAALGRLHEAAGGAGDLSDLEDFARQLPVARELQEP
jgi:hypothetical protein